MTKVSIAIENIADRKACVVAIRQLFAALEEQYGEKEAERIWRYNNDLQAPKWRAREKLSRALAGLEYGDRRIIFEYYAMAKPSKEGLAKKLASKNGSLHEKWREWLAANREWWSQHGEEYRRQSEIIELARGTEHWPPKLPRLPEFPQRPAAPFGPRGTTEWQTMLQHIKRIFRNHKEACAAIGDATPELRKEELLEVEPWCQSDAERRAISGRSLKMYRKKRGGTKSKR
jgi:hypothetical protein